jgi:hypothetical protein
MEKTAVITLTVFGATWDLCICGSHSSSSELSLCQDLCVPHHHNSVHYQNADMEGSFQYVEYLGGWARTSKKLLF